jgi:hypothetical protein
MGMRMAASYQTGHSAFAFRLLLSRYASLQNPDPQTVARGEAVLVTNRVVE